MHRTGASPHPAHARVVALAALFALAAGGRGFGQAPLITEFLAINNEGLADEDGDRSDWIEIHNPGPEAVDLEDWYLTDDAGDLRKWRFPAVVLPPGGFLLVFASDKDRADPGGELHANFRLSREGEFLALVAPDGETVVHAYEPTYPRQLPDISYGLGRGAKLFVRADTPARLRVPRDGADGSDWTLPEYDDTRWMEASGAIGFDVDVGPPGPPAVIRNLASGGAATQSSTLDGFGPERALNGDLGDFTHTAAGRDLPASWEVDLGDLFAITRIVLHNRRGCCRSRLRDITVSVLDPDDGTISFESGLLNPENILGGGGTDGPEGIELDLLALTGGPVEGRVVRVVRTPDPDLSGSGGAGNADEPDVLSLAEVEVFGGEPSSGARFTPFFETEVAPFMLAFSASIQLRAPFEVEDPAALQSLVLRIRYDDGFVAYLNGVEVARRNAPEFPAWDAAATEAHPDDEAVVPETIDLTGAIDFLRPGRNVLAFLGLNRNLHDGDFLIAPELAGTAPGVTEARYFRRPTPGEKNGEPAAIAFVADTKFSHDRGFYDAPFDLEITTETPGAEIRYTLDGTAPTARTGFVYNGPIWIDRTTVVRAAAFEEGMEPTNVDTQTYIFPEDVVRQDRAATLDAGFPPTWGGTTPDYGMDPDCIGPGDRYGGKYAAEIVDALLQVPTLSLVLEIDDMFGTRGIYTNSTSRGTSWERAASVELILPDGRGGFQVDAGLRIHGGAFRGHGLTKKHSLRLLFKGQYGATKLRYPLFGPNAADRFDTIVLRANSNDGWQWAAAGARPLYVRDAFARQTVLHMGAAASHGIFVHVYIDGIYWGLYEAVERPDASFSATYFGGDKDAWDAISNGEAHTGDTRAWSRMVSMARDLSSDADYYAIQGRNPDGTENPDLEAYLDVENFAIYMIANLYIGNTDWPHKNYWVGRPQDGSTGFKFYSWDAEWSIGIRSDLQTNQVGVSAGVAAPWPGLKRNAEFRMLVADILHAALSPGGALYVDPTHPRWDPEHPERNIPAVRFARLAAGIEKAIVAESARWGDQHASVPYTRDEHWAQERDNLLRNYFPYRSAIVRDQFRRAGLYPDLEAPFFNRHGGRVPPGFVLAIGAAAGTVYYTIDGPDPRRPGGAIDPAALRAAALEPLVLVPEGAPARVLVPADGSLGLDWTAPDFEDAAWRAGRTGIGYERSSGYEALIETDVEAEMYDRNPSVYIRISFQVDDPSTLGFLTLRMKYDDGYIAYLNGERVADRNASADPSWDSDSTRSHNDSEARIFEAVDLTGAIGRLRPGRNVLAVHGLNTGLRSSDFLVLPRLEASRGLEEIVLERTAVVRARAWQDGEWSALAEATFILDTGLRLTEIMYHPRDGERDGDAYEFIELKNVGPESVDLTDYAFIDGIAFTFPWGTQVRPGGFVLVVSDEAAFVERYGPVPGVAGAYAGRLSNAGERLILAEPAGNPVFVVPFDDDPPWPPAADGTGRSLVAADPDGEGDPGTPAYWRTSEAIDGSPGADEPGVGPPPGGRVRPGDLNGNGSVEIGDAIALLGYLFGGAGPLPCAGGAEAPGNGALLDANGSGRTDLADAIFLLSYLFQGGPPPALGEACVPLPGCPDLCPE